MTEAADRAGRYWLASGGLLARIQATPDDRWDAASPCAEWTARDVVAHVINGHRGILAVVKGTRPVAAGGDERLAPDLVARTHQALLPHYENLQATGAFAPSIPAPGDADPQSAFLYFTGRRP